MTSFHSRVLFFVPTTPSQAAPDHRFPDILRVHRSQIKATSVAPTTRDPFGFELVEFTVVFREFRRAFPASVAAAPQTNRGPARTF
jgi:hypothetical protein